MALLPFDFIFKGVSLHLESLRWGINVVARWFVSSRLLPGRIATCGDLARSSNAPLTGFSEPNMKVVLS